MFRYVFLFKSTEKNTDIIKPQPTEPSLKVIKFPEMIGKIVNNFRILWNTQQPEVF